MDMKLTAEGSALKERLLKLIREHDKIAIAVAWASSNTEVYTLLKENKKKIKYVVIGTHFYQTRPEVLEHFIGCNEVRFELQPQGVFHPKAYLFWSDEKWDIFIGSANLTAGAMGINSELMLNLSSKDNNESQKLKDDILKQIELYWQKAEVMTVERASVYRKLWGIHQTTLKRLAGNYSGSKTSKAPIDSVIITMTWDLFLQRVQNEMNHNSIGRCDLLDFSRGAFSRYETFSNMELNLRKTIAGLPNELNANWAWFGSMRGVGSFSHEVIENNIHLSNALDIIPMNGIVDFLSYNLYIDEFKRAFPSGRDGVGVASRLLALKRPDYFVCFNSKNKKELCIDFGIRQGDFNYERYWTDIICRIVDSVWWNEPQPLEGESLRIWKGRAAMLDAIFYQP